MCCPCFLYFSALLCIRFSPKAQQQNNCELMKRYLPRTRTRTAVAGAAVATQSEPKGPQPGPDLKSVQQGEATCKRKRKILCYSFGFSTLLAKQAATRLDWFTQQPLALPLSHLLCFLTAYSFDPLGRAFICSVQSCRLCWIRVACVSWSRQHNFLSVTLAVCTLLQLC